MRRKYKLGLALSGGGAKGAAECGMLQALKEYGVRPDVVSGTSVGSIVGALYCAGVDPVDMCNMFINLNFRDLIGISRPKAGFFDQTPLVEYLCDFIPVKCFEDLTIPFSAVACDLNRGRIKVFDSGELAPRIMASCSIPIFFQPMIIDGVPYVDGGVYKNLPVSVLTPCCEKVIGVSVHATTEGYKNNMLSVSLRVFHLILKANTLEDSRHCDMFIEFDTSKYSQFDLDNIEELFMLGYNEALPKLEEWGYLRQMPPQPVEFKRAVKTPIKERIVNSRLYVKLTDLIEENEVKLKRLAKK